MSVNTAEVDATGFGYMHLANVNRSSAPMIESISFVKLRMFMKGITLMISLSVVSTSSF